MLDFSIHTQIEARREWYQLGYEMLLGKIPPTATIGMPPVEYDLEYYVIVAVDGSSKLSLSFDRKATH